MHTDTIYKHEDDSTITAMGVDQQKMEFILNHIQQARDRGHHTKVSESLAEIIKLAATPEEIALAALAIGKGHHKQRMSPGDIIGKLRALEMLGELFDDMFKEREDGPDTEE